ncbi:3-oxoacyl-[acyl-carrier-protein] synthase I, chloroplastic-like [Carex rostrata]
MHNSLLFYQPILYTHPIHRRLQCRASASVTVSASRRETNPKKRVVITGMGLVSVFGNDVDKFYDRIGGQIKDFSSEGYIDSENDMKLDDCWKQGRIYCSTGGINKSRAGVLVGSGMGGVGTFSEGLKVLRDGGYQELSANLIPNTVTNMGSALLGIDIGFLGPTYSISTACATSNYCFHAAANHIKKCIVDVMLAGGTEACILPAGLAGFVACRALSQRNDDPATASRPWDKGRDGFVMGEGAGVLVMESLEHAMKRDAPIIAEYLGGAVNCDAYHITDPRADGLGVSNCIKQGLENAGVAPGEVNYINAHATSTLMGDLAEINALKQVFKSTTEIKINGTKSMIGHCLGAAGGMEAIATIKAITTGWLHPTINQFNIDPNVELDTVPNKKQEHEVNVAISNSFGFGGHNAVVVFAPFEA